MHCCALIVAAGAGSRLDPALPKQFLPLAGRPMIARTVAAFRACRAIDSMVIVAAAEQIERMRGALAGGCSTPLTVCAGGAERSDSVWAGLQRLPPAAELVAIHDGARPLVTPALIERVVHAAACHGAALPALPLTDTVKEVEPRSTVVCRTASRERLRRAQTPQVFAVELVRRAYDAYRETAPRQRVTDDAQVVERFGGGHAVHVVEGETTNIKITVGQDLLLAEALLRSQGPSASPHDEPSGRDARARASDRAAAGDAASSRAPCCHRTGFGYDVHRLAEGRRLILGGVQIPFARGLAGHSDADVLCHAVGDALLGATALGDIGQHFPPGDERYRDASSLELLVRIRELVAGRGYRVVNLDCTVVCEAPRIAPFARQMRGNLARALDVDPVQVNVKATTTEGLGFAGRGEGIAAYATAHLEHRTV